VFELKVGDSVKIHGLATSLCFNDSVGVVEEFIDGRWKIWVRAGAAKGKRGNIKPENLTRVNDPPSITPAIGGANAGADATPPMMKKPASAMMKKPASAMMKKPAAVPKSPEAPKAANGPLQEEAATLEEPIGTDDGNEEEGAGAGIGATEYDPKAYKHAKLTFMREHRAKLQAEGMELSSKVTTLVALMCILGPSFKLDLQMLVFDQHHVEWLLETRSPASHIIVLLGLLYLRTMEWMQKLIRFMISRVG
jgi:hypothetical protein